MDGKSLRMTAGLEDVGGPGPASLNGWEGPFRRMDSDIREQDQATPGVGGRGAEGGVRPNGNHEEPGGHRASPDPEG